MTNKHEIISNVFYDLSGHGSIIETMKDAKAIDKSIKFSNVKEWLARHVQSQSQVKGANSFVANCPYQEHQLDLMFMKNLT